MSLQGQELSSLLKPVYNVLPGLYGQKLELIKALKVLNEGFTIGLHVNLLGFSVRVWGLGFGLGLVPLPLRNSISCTFLTYVWSTITVSM